MAKNNKFIDLSGQKFGMLTVINRGENLQGNVAFNCICDCGNTCNVRSYNLKSGKTVSCGCYRPQINRKNKKVIKNVDLVGVRFGNWTVLEKAESVQEPNGRWIKVWFCQCDCGTKKNVREGSLKSGSSKSCGCLKVQKLLNNHYLIGQIFGRWTVLKKGELKQSTKNNRTWQTWTCECECGTIRDVMESSLLSGKSTSCGCLRTESLKKIAVYDDLTGQKFGDWTVLSREPDRFYSNKRIRSQMWLCQCVCGATSVVARAMLKSGGSQSCGCRNEPLLESHVVYFLENFNYKYERQKKYTNLLGVGEQPLSYDFLVYIDEKPLFLIECQGEQHFRPVKHFGGKSRFEIQQIHDQRKRDFAKNNNLQLIELTYQMKRYSDIENYLISIFNQVV